MSKLLDLSRELFSLNVIKFGSFLLKSGNTSPIYVDLRSIISKPSVLQSITDLMNEKIQTDYQYDLICGVPYTALSIATAWSLKFNIPMLIKRKEAKDYGTKKMIEGVFSPRQKCLIIDDVITSASSIIETKVALEKEGLEITRAVVFLDREAGGKGYALKENLEVSSVLTLSQLLDILFEDGKILKENYEEAKAFVNKTKIKNHA